LTAKGIERQADQPRRRGASRSSWVVMARVGIKKSAATEIRIFD
jgi:hypothetical protein